MLFHVAVAALAVFNVFNSVLGPLFASFVIHTLMQAKLQNLELQGILFNPVSYRSHGQCSTYSKISVICISDMIDRGS